MRKCIKWLLLAPLLLVVIAGALLWQEQSSVADKILARYAPDLHYDAVTLDSVHGKLALHRVRMVLSGVAVNGGDVEVTIDPATLLHGPLILQKVQAHGLRIQVDLAAMPLFPEAGEGDAFPLPESVVIKGAKVTLLNSGLPHLAPLRIAGNARYDGHRWSVRSAVQLDHGVVRLSGRVGEGQASGGVKFDKVTVPALWQQLGLDDTVLAPQGEVTGALQWKLPEMQPDGLQIQGKVVVQGVSAVWQQKRQQLGDVTVELSWQGAKQLLRLHRVKVQHARMRWLYRLQGERAALRWDDHPALHWQLDRLQLEDGGVAIAVETPAGTASLPLLVKQLTVQDMRWNRLWPKQAQLRASVHAGAFLVSLRGHDINIDVKGVKIAPLEPLAIAFSGLRIPKGALSLKLRGEVAPQLKLFGDMMIHHLALAPRIPIAGVDLSIPYGLGLRALTNEQHITHIPLAIRGTIKAPEVDINEIISEVKKNLFSGHLGGGIQHFSVDFLTHTRGLTPTGEKQLAQLVYLLQQGGISRVSLRGCVDPLDHDAPTQQRKLAAMRVQVVKQALQRHGATVDVIYPALTTPSPDIDGKNDRVEVDIYPRENPR